MELYRVMGACAVVIAAFFVIPLLPPPSNYDYDAVIRNEAAIIAVMHPESVPVPSFVQHLHKLAVPPANLSIEPVVSKMTEELVEFIKREAEAMARSRKHTSFASIIPWHPDYVQEVQAMILYKIHKREELAGMRCKFGNVRQPGLLSSRFDLAIECSW